MMNDQTIQNFFQSNAFVTGTTGNNRMVNSFPGNVAPVAPSAHLQVAPQLNLLKQTSLAEETVSKNGLQRSVHVLVKNTPFQLVVGFTNVGGAQHATFNFNTLALDIALLYDCEKLTPVSFIKTKPVTYKPKITENGTKVSLNCRLKVLTSQHEDMFFRVRIKALKPVTMEELDPPLEVISAPIRVVSKPEQLKGRKKPKATRTRKRKRTVTDMLVETVNRLEKQVQVHHKIFEKMMNPENQTASFPGQIRLPANLINEFNGDESPCKKRRIEEVLVIDRPNRTTPLAQQSNAGTAPVAAPVPTDADPNEIAKQQFERAFTNLLTIFSEMKPQDRSLMVRKVVKSRTVKETDTLCELVDMLSANGLNRSMDGVAGNMNAGGLLDRNVLPNFIPPPGPMDTPMITSSQPSPHTDACNIICPHKKELEKIDEFYSSLFFPQ